MLSGFSWWKWGDEEEEAEKRTESTPDEAEADTAGLFEDAAHARLSMNLPQDLPPSAAVAAQPACAVS